MLWALTLSTRGTLAHPCMQSAPKHTVPPRRCCRSPPCMQLQSKLLAYMHSPAACMSRNWDLPLTLCLRSGAARTQQPHGLRQPAWLDNRVPKP